MNCKIVATLIVGALLVTACGAQQGAPATGTMRAGEEEGAPAAGNPTVAPATNPGAQPAAKDPAAAKKDAIMHE